MAPMTQFILGALLGSFITGGLSVAGTFYDSNGQPAALAGASSNSTTFASASSN
jgi:hypothetical protein